MDFGRLPSLEGVSFALPAIDDRSRALLAAAASARAAAPTSAASDPRAPAGASAADPHAPAGSWLRAGAPAWARKDWLGRLYPRGTPDSAFLRTYAQRLGAIELNASYYRVPTSETLAAWAADTPEGFHFCPKLHQSITHRRALEESIPEAQDFARRLLQLGPRLGPAFLQLPPWLGSDALPALDALLASLPAAFRVAVEMRHPTWFHRGALRAPVAAVLERRGAGAVVTDVAGRRDVCHGSITAPFLLVRFVGNGFEDRGLHPTDLPRADAWLDRLVSLRAQGLEYACFFAHQPDDALAPETLTHFVTRARARGIEMPSLTLEPTQLGLF